MEEIDKNKEKELRKNLIMDGKFDEVPIATVSSGSFCGCCQCCSTKVTPKEFFINNWRKLLAKEYETKKNIDDPFRILASLWAQKNVIKDLEQIRLNPNLINPKQIRNDLEFYIPQLCSFLIFGEYEIVEEFLAFLCKACYASFHFAHRIIWFLKSVLDKSSEHYKKIYDILMLIQSIFKSEKDNNIIEQLNIASSGQYVEYLEKNQSLFIYNPNIDVTALSNDQVSILDKKRRMKESSDEFVKKHYDHSTIPIEGNSEFNWDTKYKPDDLFFDIFKERKLNIEDIKTPFDLETFEQLDYDDVNLNSFVSNIHFYDHLCNICEKIKLTSQEKQLQDLQYELMLVNKSFPSNNYIPFTKDATRNFIICHIPVTEVKIFRTKNRAPYCITVEMFRLDEINHFNKMEKNIWSVDREVLRISHKISSKKKVTPNTGSTGEVDKRKGVEDKNRSNSYSNSEINTNKGEIKEVRERMSLQKNHKTFVMNPNFTDSEKKAMSFLDESDIRISKPLMITNINPPKEKSKLKDVEEVDEEDESLKRNSFVKIKKIDDYVKKRATLVVPKSKMSEHRITSKNNKISKDDNDIKNNMSHDHLQAMVISQDFSKNSKIDEVNSKIEEVEEDKSMASDDIKLKETKTNIKNESQDDQPVEIIVSNFLRQSEVIQGNDKYFGELIEEQEERLRKVSPYGNLNTWKIVRLIVKSGEDLRQEQFATQLINEFNQIFKIEKVDCWVSSYEIIATGNIVGIIECIPNAISVDQLKRKNPELKSLRQFFESYYGAPDTARFKKAMNNYVKSIAGYSLVCYLLQIKDRHNGNIMIDNQGHIIHIDFGFMLSNAPGKGIKFEKAPFKLTLDYLDAMGGVNSSNFSKFRKLVQKGFIAISKHAEKITTLVEMMWCGHGIKLPCFERGEETIENLKYRFYPEPNMNNFDKIHHVDSLIEQSIDNWRTKWYDKFQYYVQGIFY